MTRLAAIAPALLALLPGMALADPFKCPRMGGDLAFGLGAKVAGLDQHVSPAGSTRDVTSNIYETLVTRDDTMKPILQLAKSVDVSADQKTFIFHLREGVKFHNGKTMTSDDVLASYQRYQKVGVDRSILDIVDRFETPDASTFTIVLKDTRPTFLESLSYFTVPIVIIPRENANAAPQQLPPVGTGPFQLVEFVADSHVKLKRFEGYTPNTDFTEATGFGGYKQPCLDTVTLRMTSEPAARTAALETGELQGVQDVPTASQKRLAENKSIKLLRLENFWLNVTYPNQSFPPTDNLKVRQAILAAMDMNEIMDAASDGAYKLNPSFQFPGTPYYTEAGKELYNQHNIAKAKQLLQEGGYKGEKVILMTNREYPSMYNTSLVMSEQLKAAGINAELLVLDWPTALQKSVKDNEGWNFFYTGWITVTALGGAQSLRNLADPSNVHKPQGNKSDPEFMAAFRKIESGSTLDERRAAFATAQARAFDQVMAVPFGVMPKVQAMRTNVEGFKPYYSPRFYNVWLTN